jgi:hypothetical protein
VFPKKLSRGVEMKLNLSKWLVIVFCLFLATDIGFIICHLIYVYSGLSSNYAFSLEQDRGYSEIFQYIKEYWVVLLLGFIAWRKRSLSYLIWSLLFLYLLFDDYFMIHEKMGWIISDRLGFTPALNLRAKDFGEVAMSAFVGLIFLILLATSYYFGDRLSREVSKYMLIMLGAFAFCGIIVDMVHIAVKIPSLYELLTILEDGGELVVMSIIAAFVLFLCERLESGTDKLNRLEKKLPSFNLVD